jgi:SpoU rRNA methylase family enzyme
MAFTVAVFTQGKSHWWMKVADAIAAALPGADVLVFRGIDEWLGAIRGLSGEHVLLMGPRTPAEMDVILAARELVRGKDLLVVLPREMEALEARARELQPRILLPESVGPEAVAEAVRKMYDRSRRRLDRWDWSDVDAGN